MICDMQRTGPFISQLENTRPCQTEAVLERACRHTQDEVLARDCEINVISDVTLAGLSTLTPSPLPTMSAASSAKQSMDTSQSTPNTSYMPELCADEPTTMAHWADPERQGAADVEEKSTCEPKAEQSPFLVSWDETDKHKNPRGWTRPYRMFLVFLVSCYTVLSPIASTSNVPALDVLRRDFGVDSFVVGNMMMSAPMLAFVVAPIFYAPLSEQFGRKYILQVTNIVYVSMSYRQLLDFQPVLWLCPQLDRDDHFALLYGYGRCRTGRHWPGRGC